jgi:multiple sugar transport system substrate-binding protein
MMKKLFKGPKASCLRRTKAVRALAAALLTALLAGLLSGCHGTQGLDPFEMPEEFDTSRQYEITFWAKNDTNVAQTRIYEAAIAGFEALYPNVHVNLRLYTDYGRIYNDVITNIATNTTPNVCVTYPDHIATYMTGSNVVVPLDDVFQNAKYGLAGSELRFDGPSFSQIVPQYIGECRIGEHWYAIPYMRSSEALYINKTFVEKLGYEVPEVATWDWIWEVSEAAMAKNPDGTFALNGQNVMIPFIYKSTDNMMIQQLRQKGAPYSTEDGEVLIFSDVTKELLKEISKHAGSGAFSTFKISSYPANFLNAGQSVFSIDSTAGATWMGSKAPNIDIAADRIVEFETVVRPIPQFDAEHPVMISQGPSICVFNKQDPQEVLASWLFAQYMLTNDVQTAYARTEGYVPVTTKAQQDPDYEAYLSGEGKYADEYSIKLDATRLILDNIPNTFTTPVFNGSASLRDAAGQMIENVCKSMRRGQTVDDAYFDSLYSSVNSLYRLDQLSSTTAGKKELGPLPETSKLLLGGIAAAWVLIGIYVIWDRSKARRKS